MTIGVSLGWNCHPAVYAVYHKFRPRKTGGYKTCVFDLMISNYPGVVECIKDDFKHFLDLKYISAKNFNGEILIYNSYYKFVFNHESPGHANLYITEAWENGKEHFILNNYASFISRYHARIENFRNYLKSEQHITFVLNRHKSTSVKDVPELIASLKTAYPNLKCNVLFSTNRSIPNVKSQLLNMGFTEDDDEVKRLK